MNIIIVPFHDWRKILLEGFRTRDSHFIEEFNKDNTNIKVIINRPTTIFEILLKRKKNLIKGKVVFSNGGFKLYKLEEKVYLIDYVSKDVFGQVTKGYKWFIEQYGNKKYINFINACFQYLNIDSYFLLSQNVFAYKISEKLKPNVSVFDAWDNFIKFKVYKDYIKEISNGYTSLAKVSNFWITNSKDNINEFNKLYKPKRVHIILNGVDLNRFVNNKETIMPNDLSNIKRPIIGFGGKFSQLIDVDLLNNTMSLSPNISFVFVGQILDKAVFNRIDKRSNFYYLGDKHYNDYPNYVKNFDICIIPYVTKEDQKSGANSIKVYEYLATRKKVIGTNGNGLEELSEHVYLVNNAKEFSKELQSIDNKKHNIDAEKHSWVSKTNHLLYLVKNEG